MDRGPAVRPNWNRLFEIAAAQEGLFTTKQAAEARYSPQLLTHYVHAGRAIRVGWSIYRLVHFPAGEHEELVAAGACRCRSGPRAIWRARRVTRTYSTPVSLQAGPRTAPPHVRNQRRRLRAQAASVAACLIWPARRRAPGPA
ncbi:MAG: type IV toxin-antitoxin system AbiEi family antitoxin domain-containing protein [Polyangia bacterium]